MNDETLLPCPFCGGRAEIKVGGHTKYAMCLKCEVMSVNLSNDAELIQAWNTRAQASAPDGGNSPFEQLSELMRGLEIPPSAVASLKPIGFYAIGAAIAAQAKKAEQTNTHSNAKAGEVEVIGDGCVDRITRYSDGSGFIELAFQDVPKVESGQWLILSTHDKTKA